MTWKMKERGWIFRCSWRFFTRLAGVAFFETIVGGRLTAEVSCREPQQPVGNLSGGNQLLSEVVHEKEFCRKILGDFGVDVHGGLINGHVPVKLEKGGIAY
jgi:hypothetical protein